MFDLSGKLHASPEHRAGERSDAVARATKEQTEAPMFDLSGKTALITGAPEHRAGERSDAVARATKG